MEEQYRKQLEKMFETEFASDIVSELGLLLRRNEIERENANDKDAFVCKCAADSCELTANHLRKLKK